jgi:hypothetical protein
LRQATTAAQLSNINRLSGYRQALAQFDIHACKFSREQEKVFGSRNRTDSPAKICQFVDGVMCLLQGQSCGEQPARDGYSLIERTGAMQHHND